MASETASAARAAIAALVYEYAERIDAGDLGGVAALFAEATYRSAQGGLYRGRDAVLTVLRQRVILHGDGGRLSVIQAEAIHGRNWPKGQQHHC